MTEIRTTTKILIAEDNQVNGVLALRMLKKLGYEADIALNGLEAINAIKSKHYDIVLMDIQMPEMDGLEATHWILNHHDSPAPPIIAMTANTLPNDQITYRLAGMVDLICKPLSLDEIKEVVARWEKSSNQG